MNKNILIVLAGAVLVAVLVAVMVQVMVGGKDEPVVQEEKVNILVAAKDLKTGSPMQNGDVRWQAWPKSSVFPGAVRQLEGQAAKDAVKGRFARDIAKGEPVMKSAMLGESKGNFVAASLEPGMRAIAISVDAQSMVGGFVGPGDFVDVILTYKISMKKAAQDDEALEQFFARNVDDTATETILQNVKVLAIDQSAQRPQDDKIKVGRTITLAVDAEDSERLALARKMGDLNLVLRGVGDDKIVERKWPTVSDARLSTIEDEIFQEYERLKQERGGTAETLKIYSGNTLQAVQAR